MKPIPSFDSGLIEIPVTANPIFKIDKRYILPFSYYDMFNMESLKKTNKIDFFNFIQNVISFQVSKNVTPHLIFLGHNWEFTDFKKGKFNYSSEDNYEILNSFLKSLEEKYKVKYLTLEELSKEFEGIK
ncbi:MAG: hypothetical protein GF368_02640 [Candidatus Aenigmarchaeota archaeon]|nr:hypothetical protein [Candidatus Aenigmarchaeota archaeon]